MIGIQIDGSELQRIAAEFGASEAQVRAAWRRAKSRTASRLRTQARKALRQELGLRSAAVLRARLRLRNTRDGASLWVGLNNMRASSFKGRVRAGASGVSVAGQTFGGAFLARGQVFRRVGSRRLPIEVQTVPIKDEGDAVLEGEVMRDAVDTLMRNFAAEIRARTIYGVAR